MIPRGCIICVRVIPANKLVYLVAKLTTMFEVEHHKTDQNRRSHRGGGTIFDDIHGSQYREVQATFERLLEHQQKSEDFNPNSDRHREVGIIAENNPIIVTDHGSIQETDQDIQFTLLR